LYEAHKGLLDPLLRFFTDRGRLPSQVELPSSPAIISAFGSIGRAFAVIRRATGSETWTTIEHQRNEDLLLYLAQAQFDRPAKFTDLAPELRGDIRAFHGSYSKAILGAIRMLRQLADQDLINAACKSVGVGKETPQAIYLHRDAIGQLPTVLRLYEACARGLVGEVEGANIVKLHRYRPQVSYLCYPGFDKEAHPALASSAVVNLDEARSSFKDYSQTPNPPILHRKESFVSPDYPGHKKFATLTKQEEAAGLFANPSKIGFLRDWLLALDAAGVSIRGHRLVRRRPR
ncbi:MAG: DNA phosphorothioation-associated putative methyltransferase, partial [Planctomycetes bacterium]|nr:DNA phosphorothioation-associated putative methyltransferase [Planctomycetota bacterium]